MVKRSNVLDSVRNPFFGGSIDELPMGVKVKGSTPYVTISVGVGLRAKIPAIRFNVLYFKAGKKYHFVKGDVDSKMTYLHMIQNIVALKPWPKKF